MKHKKIFYTLNMLLLVPGVVFNVNAFNESDLKILFTSPAERHSIDASRQGLSSSSIGSMPTGTSNVHIKGIVTRSEGKSVVWVNGQNTMNNNMVGGVKVFPDAMNKKNQKIPVLVDGRKVYVKPGETWSEDTGVSDATNK